MHIYNIFMLTCNIYAPYYLAVPWQKQFEQILYSNQCPHRVTYKHVLPPFQLLWMTKNPTTDTVPCHLQHQPKDSLPCHLHHQPMETHFHTTYITNQWKHTPMPPTSPTNGNTVPCHLHHIWEQCAYIGGRIGFNMAMWMNMFTMCVGWAYIKCLL